jgi:hypothetical protein
MGTECAFVGDGYDMRGAVPRAPGIHPECKFTYRPATREERARAQREALKDGRDTDVYADLIARHVSEWSLGEKPTRERVLKLQPSLFDRIVEVASRSCADCQKYLYDDRPNGMATKVTERGGQKVERIPGQRPRCEWCPKVAKGDPPVPASAQDISVRNLEAVVHYRECRAVLRFPDDPWVRRNAAIIRDVEDAMLTERMQVLQLETLIALRSPIVAPK